MGTNESTQRGYSANETVLEMAKLNITGDVVPAQWYQTIRNQSGKPDLAAICILAEVVYWYRPIEERDQHTGKFLGYRKRFKADKLQRNYGALCEKFGLSRGQVRRALETLEALGLIQREFRNIHVKQSKMILSNVMFIGLNVKRLEEVSHGNDQVLESEAEDYDELFDDDLVTDDMTVMPPMTIGHITGDMTLMSPVTLPIVAHDKTYTEITTENTTKNTTERITADAFASAPTSKPNRTAKKEGGKQETGASGSKQQEMFGALCEVCIVDGKLNAARVGRQASKLVDAGYKAEDVRRWYGKGGWWYAKDWRGKQGQTPALEQVGETIAKANKEAPVANPAPKEKRKVRIHDIWTGEDRVVDG